MPVEYTYMCSDCGERLNGKEAYKVLTLIWKTDKLIAGYEGKGQWRMSGIIKKGNTSYYCKNCFGKI